MKKISAILLILVLAGAQYARQLNYLQCRLSNTFKSSRYQCDCEKQSGLGKKAPSQSPVPLSHIQHFPDEYDSLVFMKTGETRYTILRTIPTFPGGEDLNDGNYPGPWRPPDT